MYHLQSPDIIDEQPEMPVIRKDSSSIEGDEILAEELPKLNKVSSK